MSVGNAAPHVVERVREQVARFTHTCFMITPHEGYVEVCEALNRLTPGDHEKRSALFNSGAEAVEKAISIIDKQVGASETAAVIIEPIQGEGGLIVPAPGFLPAISQWCTDNGVVFVADEIQTGFARTGAMFACEHEDVVPDLVATAKGIAGGLPLAGLTGRADLMDAVHTGGLGGTFGGNPVACAAGLGAMETIEELGLVARAGDLETILLERLRDMGTRHPVIGDVRGRDAMIAVEFVRPGTTEPAADICGAVAKAAHAAGVVVLTCGTYGNVIRLLPPLVIPEHLLNEGLDVLDEAIAGATA